MLDSLTPAQKTVLALAVGVLLAGFWLSAGGLRDGEAPAERRAEYAAPDRDAAMIAVHVIGEVQRPGVYTLSAGTRVMDAIRAAGGFTPRARQESVNLAAFCDDGEQVCVQALPEEQPGSVAAVPAPAPEPERRSAAAPTSSPSVGAATRPAPHAAAPPGVAAQDLPDFLTTRPGSPIRLNYAGVEELQEIPGVGPELAKRIIYYRAMHGPFRSFSELGNIEGIGPATIEEIRVSATLN